MKRDISNVNNKQNLISRLFSKKRDDFIGKQDPRTKEKLMDALSKSKYRMYYSSEFLPRYYNKFINTNDDLKMKLNDFVSMYKDPILSMALEYIVDDTTQYSNITKKRMWCVSNDSELVTISNNLFSRVGLQDLIWYITARTALIGTCFIRLYYRNEDFTGGITAIEVEEDLFRYIPIELNGVLIKFIDKYNDNMLEPFEIIPIRINMLNDHRLIDDFYDISVKDINQKNQIKNTFRYGSSFFENTRRVWKQRLLVEDSLILTRLENAPIVRLFKIAANGMTDDDASEMVDYYSDLLSYDNKSISQAENLIKGSDTQLGYGAKIVIPVGETGDLTVEEFGGNADVSSIVDLDRLDKIYYASLRVPPEFLGVSSENGGLNIGESSIIRKEMRYARTAKKIQYAEMNFGKTLAYYNFLSLNINVNYEEDYDVLMSIISTAEDEEYKSSLKMGVEAFDGFMGVIGSIKELLADTSINKDSLMDLLYFMTNKILNITDFDWNSFFSEYVKSDETETVTSDEIIEEPTDETSNEDTSTEEAPTEEIPEEVPGEEVFQSTKKSGKHYFEKSAVVYSKLPKEKRSKLLKILENFISRVKYECPRFSSNSTLDYIKECFITPEKKYVMESLKTKLQLNKENIKNLIETTSIFDISIFNNIKVSDKSIDISQFKIDKIEDVKIELKDIFILEDKISSKDIVSAQSDAIINIYKLENDYYINYTNLCRLLKNILDGFKYNFKMTILKIK